MKKVLSFEIPSEKQFSLELPKDSEITNAMAVRSGYRVKALLTFQCDTDNPNETRLFIQETSISGAPVDVPENAIGLPFVFNHEERRISYYIWEAKSIKIEPDPYVIEDTVIDTPKTTTSRLASTVKRIKDESATK
jgi:hypothetical protein